MYTQYTTELGRLKAYHRELRERYAQALSERRWDDAHAIRDRQARVKRAILIREEWQPTGTVSADYNELLTPGR